MAVYFDQDEGLLKEVWIRHEWKPKLWSRSRQFFPLKNHTLTRSWPLDWRDCFGHVIKWDAPFSFGLWAWPLEASHYARPKAPIPIFY
jgi:hypothetical protein